MTETSNRKPATARLQAALAPHGMPLSIVEYPQSTHTADDAAATIGCMLGQIAKSLIFVGKSSGSSILVVASGDNRVDEKKLRNLVGEKIGRADAAFVRLKTGFAIGGVPPLGHVETPTVVLDQDLRRFDEIWAAAGTPNAVFRLSPDQLSRITGAAWADIRKEP